MNIPVELLLILIVGLLFLFWAIWFRISNKILLKKYKPDNDKSRKGEEIRRAKLDRGKSRDEKPVINLDGFAEFDPRELLQATAINELGEDIKPNGKTSNSNGKVSSKFRNPFRKR